MRPRATVLVLVGTRPEAIKLAPVVKRLRRERGMRTVLACSSQQKGLEEVLNDFEETVDIRLRPRFAGDLTGDLVGLMEALRALLSDVQPDYVLVQGDTLTALAGGLAAFLARIRFGHVEAGLRAPSVNRPFPEEAVRRLLAVVADSHFAPSLLAAENLNREGVPCAKVVVTGNTGIDALRYMRRRLSEDSSFRARVRSRLVDALGGELPEVGTYVVVTSHRRENRGDGVREICGAVKDLVRRARRLEVVVVLHPNPSVAEPFRQSLEGGPRVTVVEPLGYAEFLLLLEGCRFVMTDSGGLQEEAPFLGKRLVLMREETERSEAVASGMVRVAGGRREGIVKTALRVWEDGSVCRPVALYGSGRAAERIVSWLKRKLRVFSRRI